MEDERMKVKFNTRNQKLVLITTSEEGMKLEKFVGLTKRSEARLDAADINNPEMTMDGIKQAIEEFRAE